MSLALLILLLLCLVLWSLWSRLNGVNAEVRRLRERLDAGELKNHPAQVMQGGFEGILEGIEMIRRKEVNGFKLVYPVN